jgi:hypothetical protein
MTASTSSRKELPRGRRALRGWLTRLLDQRVAWPLCGVGAAIVLYGSLSPALAPPDLLNVDKLIHLFAYGALATVGFLPCGNARRGWPIAATLLALGGFIEVAQTFVPGRSGSVGDFIANACGVLLGVSLSRLVRQFALSWGALQPVETGAGRAG